MRAFLPLLVAKEYCVISRGTAWAKNVRPIRLGVVFIVLTLIAAFAFPVFPTNSASYCRVRVLIASPDVGTVDVLLNSLQIAGSNKLGDLTPYSTRPADHYGLRVFAPGQSEPGKAFVGHTVYLMAGKDYTVVVFGKNADKTLDISAEVDNNALDAASAKIRFANYLPGSGTLSLTVSGGTAALESAAFGQASNTYASTSPGSVTLTATNASGVTVTQTTATLSANTTISAFTVPGAGGTGAALLLNLDAGTPTMPLNAAPVTSGASPAAAVATAVPAAAASTATSPATAATPVPSGGGASVGLRTALVPVPSVANTDAKVFYALSGHTLGGVFKTYWDNHGGLEQFGYPITEEFQEVSTTDGKTYVTQYFERARFEQHPDKAGTPFEVLQGLLGRELIKMLGAG